MNRNPQTFLTQNCILAKTFTPEMLESAKIYPKAGSYLIQFAFCSTAFQYLILWEGMCQQ